MECGCSKTTMQLVVGAGHSIHGAHYSSLCTCVYVGNFPKQRLKNIKNKSEEIIKRGGLPKYCIGGEKPVNSPRA